MSADNSAKQVGMRSLTISVMLTMLVAVVVFAVGTLAFIAPQFGVIELQLVAQKHRVDTLTHRVAELEAANEANAARAQAQAQAAAQAPAVVGAGANAAPVP